MTATHARPSDLLVAVMAAVVLHVALFLFFVVLIALNLLKKPGPGEMAPTPTPMATVEIRPEMFERPKPKPEPVVEEEIKQRFAKTNPSQASEKAPENAAFIGERNTEAASELPPDPNGPKMPSQDGVEPRRGDESNTFDSTFTDGQDGEVSLKPESPGAPPAGDPLLKPADPALPVVDPGEAEEELPPPPSGAAAEELMKTETQIPVPKKEDAEEDDQEEELLPKESESKADAQSKNTAGGAPDSKPAEETPPPKDAGFQSEIKKTKLRGSIGRKGTTALDVEDSAIGRYQAKLSKAVEREWQMNCVQYRDHITPGALTIRFLIDAKGKVSGVRFLQMMEGGEIQQGFTLKSIQKADIPPMPKDILDELNGDPLELIYNFYF